MFNTSLNRIVSVLLVVATLGIAAWAADDATPVTTFTLWQLPNQTRTQMMSYVIRTTQGKLIVLDGGNKGDAPYLANFIKERGNVVEAWFISHVHDDHVDALCEILAAPNGLKIGTVYADMPDLEWMRKNGSPDEAVAEERLTAALNNAGLTVKKFELGANIDLDGIHVEVLGVCNPEITKNAVNNSSVVLRMSDATKSVLFLGDLGVEGGEKLLQSQYAERLPSDYVQMAHHGQNGVNEAFYEKVNPSYCLWPTPQWLWDNDSGGGKGSGHWKTLEVRAWMDKRPIKKHFVMVDGLQQID